jgi:hypothetical protein
MTARDRAPSFNLNDEDYQGDPAGPPGRPDDFGPRPRIGIRTVVGDGRHLQKG